MILNISGIQNYVETWATKYFVCYQMTQTHFQLFSKKKNTLFASTT